MAVLGAKRMRDVNKKEERIGGEKLNKQGCLMRIIKYNHANDITVEFQDEYKTKINTLYCNYKIGNIINPYYPSIYDVGIIGNKYPVSNGKEHVEEYNCWHTMLERCYSDKYKEARPTYKDVTCCKEWLLYENFYEWLHSQENYEKWLDGDKWALDKDILVKGNKVYSPETCCLVPHRINSLFLKSDKRRGDLPIGVSRYKCRGYTYYILSISRKLHDFPIRYFKSPEEAFYTYKMYKEDIIKQMAQEEFDNGNITQKCYEAMMSYEVEITD